MTSPSNSTHDEMEARVFGVPFRFRSREIFPWVFTLVLLGYTAWLTHSVLELWGPPVPLQEKWVHHSEAMTKEHMALREGLDELTYVTSLTPDQKERLRLEMPLSLRKKLHQMSPN